MPSPITQRIEGSAAYGYVLTLGYTGVCTAGGLVALTLGPGLMRVLGWLLLVMAVLVLACGVSLVRRRTRLR